MRTLFCLLAVATPLAWAQLDSNTITVTASRAMPAVPDSIAFTVSVNTPPDASLDQVLAALQPAAITAFNLSAVSTDIFTASPSLTWTFNLQVPLSQVKSAVAGLTAAQTNGGQFSNSFNGAGVRNSTPLQDFQQCPMPDLFAEAQSKGQRFAALAGVTLGPLLGVSDSGQSGVAEFAGNITLIAARVPVFGFVTGGYTSSIPFFQVSAPSSPCALTVKFGILRYQ